MTSETTASECTWGPTFGQCTRPASPKSRKGLCDHHAAVDRLPAGELVATGRSTWRNGR